LLTDRVLFAELTVRAAIFMDDDDRALTLIISIAD